MGNYRMDGQFVADEPDANLSLIPQQYAQNSFKKNPPKRSRKHELQFQKFRHVKFHANTVIRLWKREKVHVKFHPDHVKFPTVTNPEIRSTLRRY
jgi:hypothetical protein